MLYTLHNWLVNVTSKKNISDCGKILAEYGCNLLKKDI